MSFLRKYCGGALHARQDIEFISPCRVGKKIRMTGRLVNIYQKRGMNYYVWDIMAVDEDGKEIVRMKREEARPI